MPLISAPKFSATQYSTLPIDNPASGGLNLKDLEFELETNQSPDMLNMMYRNGSFSKRYGQEQFEALENIHAFAYYKDNIIVHHGTSVDKLDLNGTSTTIATIDDVKGFFFNFNKKLYYIANKKYYEYDGTTWASVVPYIPDYIINRDPNPKAEGKTEGDIVDALNLLIGSWKNVFNADGTSTIYYLNEQNLDDTLPKVWFEEEDDAHLIANTGTDYKGTTYSWTYDKTNGTVTFNVAPNFDTRNSVIIQMFKDSYSSADDVLSCKYNAVFGGNNNSRLFLAGNGSSMYYYTDVFSANYFPADCYASLGNGEEDITGFGSQYNILIVFKPKEIYSLTYYIQTSSTTEEENDIGKGAFSSQLVNSRVGCDCPYTIQLVNNQLVWLSSIEGVCTLVSTNIIDERNVRPISRNINRTNDLGVEGLLDWANVKNVVSVDYDSKYFLTDPISGKSFVWDYGITPYSNTGYIEKDARRLAWFLFDNFHSNQYCKINTDLFYITDNRIAKLNYSFNDFGEAIESHYMTPLVQFFNGNHTAVEYLKNVVNLYIQCRGDTASVIKMKYITDENPNGENEPEDIILGGQLWDHFSWDTFAWNVVRFGNTFRRKCALKKVQMFSTYFSNDQVDRDMSISYLALRFNIVKLIK